MSTFAATTTTTTTTGAFSTTARRWVHYYHRHQTNNNTSNLLLDRYYRILQVPLHATISEIKVAYRKRAHQLHPDKHHGCPNKLRAFQQLKEAYDAILKEYGTSNGNSRRHDWYHQRHHHHRTTNINTSSKVYTSRPPPKHWTRVWDHQKHYDMHYGDGMRDEAIHDAHKTANQHGAFAYQSPLGKGFSFSDPESTSTLNDHSGSSANTNFNPYSKRTRQGPPTIVFEYEEGSRTMDGGSNAPNGRSVLNKRERIVQDMYYRRVERQQHQQQQQQQQRAVAREQPAGPYQRYHSASSSSARVGSGDGTSHRNQDCVIL